MTKEFIPTHIKASLFIGSTTYEPLGYLPQTCDERGCAYGFPHSDFQAMFQSGNELYLTPEEAIQAYLSIATEKFKAHGIKPLLIFGEIELPYELEAVEPEPEELFPDE